MTVKTLPAARAPALRAGRPELRQRLDWDAPSAALERWADRPMAAEADEPATISIYDMIGEESWPGEGVTAKRIAGALRQIGPVPVTVALNSPGGDMFEGVAIYNLLREHPATVTVKVMGLAASAASVIAMAGDRIEMGTGTFLMIHNAWGVVIGDRNDFAAAVGMFAEFDGAMADIYAARTGRDRTEIAAMMNDTRWLRAEEAIDKGFADATFDGPDENTPPAARAEMSACRRIDAILAKAGMARSERRRLMRDAAGMPSAAGTAMPSAGLDLGAASRLLAICKGD